MKNICIIGYGSIGKRHHNLLSSRFPEAVFDIIDKTTDLQIDDCKKKQYDLAVVCVPTSCHLEVAKEFIHNSQLIFVEKPLDSDFSTIIEYQSLFAGISLHVGCNMRYTNAYKEIEEYKDRARIVNVVATSFLPHWHNNGNWLKEYSANKSMGGGILLDGIHEPDYVSSIFGLPDKVNKIEKRIFDNVTLDSTDSCLMNWYYEKSKLMVNFVLSYGTLEKRRHCSIVLEDSTEVRVDIGRDDHLIGYERQWDDILNNGPSNPYEDCLSLYKLLEI